MKIKKHRTFIFFLTDIILIILSVYLSFLLRFDGHLPSDRVNHFLFTIVTAVIVTLPIFYWQKLYRLSWTYVSLDDIPTIFRAVSLSTIVLGTLFFLTVRDIHFLTGYPRSIIFLYPILLFILICGSRFSKRIYWQLIKGTLPSEKQWHTIITETSGKLTEPKINTVLVTGGAGYVGSVLVRKLLNKGYKVKVIDKLLFGDESIKELYNAPHFEFIKADLQKDNQEILKAVKNTDAIVHLAAIVGDPACAIQPDITIKTNYLATVNLAKICKNKGIKKFVFASTCSNYGASNKEKLKEESTLRPVSLYAESKIYAEKKLIKMTDKNFMPIIFRFSTLYGLSPRMRFDLVVNFLTMKAFVDKEITIFGGNQWRPFLHVSDVAQLIVNCLDTPFSKIKGQIFNVGSNKENYLIRDLGKIIKEVIPEVKVKYIENSTDLRTYNVLFEKLEKTFNFKPTKTVKEGVKEIYDALKQGQFPNPKDSKYYNHKINLN
ncbi:NAD-dependent epimerase/dehydratase family protein [bacterium]|nr:NAD-dependent epimerase/dehydratase family protein [bacterium]